MKKIIKKFIQEQFQKILFDIYKRAEKAEKFKAIELIEEIRQKINWIMESLSIKLKILLINIRNGM